MFSTLKEISGDYRSRSRIQNAISHARWFNMLASAHPSSMFHSTRVLLFAWGLLKIPGVNTPFPPPENHEATVAFAHRKWILVAL